MNSVMLSDDSPFEEIDLDFSFIYFGSSYSRLFVSPNGGAKNRY